MKDHQSLAETRAANRYAMLRMIGQSDGISRVQLAQNLQISKSTVTENITPLLSSGVVKETGTSVSHSGGGRRPVLLHINGEYRYIIAAELGLREPIFALSDLNGTILIQRVVTLPDDAPYSIRLRMTKEVIRQLLREGNIPEQELAIIALSSPGAYSQAENAFLLNPEFEGWQVDQLIGDLKETFSTDVFLVNDVNAAAVGEFMNGAGQGCRHLLYLSCGVGVGLGMVLGGKLFTGASGSAGEIARVKVANQYRPLRTQVEIDALMERVRREAPPATLSLAGKQAHELHFKDVVALWQQQDSFVRECIQEVAMVLGEVAAFALSLLNCDLLVFGGDYLEFESQMLPVIQNTIAQEAFDPVPVVPSSLRQSASLHGLLSLAIDALLEQISRDKG